MKKIIIIFLLLVSNLYLFSQTITPRVDIPLTISDGIYSMILFVGVDSTATTGIDPHLGEAELPPIPPVGMFFCALDLYPYGVPHLVWKDYRNAPSFPYTGTHQHTLKWQLSSGANELSISFNLPIGITMVVKDPFGGVLFNSGTLAGEGSYSVPYISLGIAIITMNYNNVGGDPSGPIWGISTTSLNFSATPVGSTHTLPVTVTNHGLENQLTITSVQSSNSYFSIPTDSLPINIAPQTSREFFITKLSTANSQQGTIEFTHNAFGSPFTLNVFSPPGLQPGPLFSMSPLSLIFAQMPVGTIDSLPVTITNLGYTNTLFINQINSSNAHFSVLTNSLPVAIEPQTYKTIYVSYISGDTLQQGIISFNHNAPGSPSVLNVSSANPGAQISFNPASIYFGSQPQTKTLWVINTGIADTLIISNIISTNNNFTITPNTFPIEIAPNTTGIFHVSINNAAGQQQGTFEFYYNAPGSPGFVQVSNYILTPSAEGILEVVSGNVHGILHYGIHPQATDGIDQFLDENELPPLPPPGAFDKRLILPANNFSGSSSSYKDFRYAPVPFTGQKEYRISYQPNFNNGIEIRWDLPVGISGVIQDIINGSFINVNIVGTGSFIVQDPVAFNKLKMIIDYELHSPVELTSFKASVNGSVIQLDWSTGSELNNRGFEIHRKTENSDWVVVDFKKGKGTTSGKNDYTYTDDVAGLNSSEVYYRLKQIDYDGTFTYSKQVIVSLIPFKYELYQNYPNPFNPSTKISWQSPVGSHQTLKVYDVLGNEVATLVNEYREAGSYEVEVDASSLASGMYIYRIVIHSDKLSAGSFTSSKKMLLLK